jgi:hypothetical protein
MTDSVIHQPPYCPVCGQRARRERTQFGMRDSCCGLHGWDGKPLVSPQVHNARNHCHRVFDRLWERAEERYTIAEPPGTPEHELAVRKMRKAARGRAYRYIAHVLGIPEPEAHMAEQTDIEILRRIYKAARDATPEEIRAWAKANPPPTKRKKKDEAPNENDAGSEPESR